MILDIKYTKDKATAKERVVFTVNQDGNIGIYFVFLVQKVEPQKVSNQITFPYWFPDQEVKMGDLVVLYTKTGKNGFKINKDSSKTYFFYRNLDNPIFKSDDICLLIESDNWEVENSPIPSN